MWSWEKIIARDDKYWLDKTTEAHFQAATRQAQPQWPSAFCSYKQRESEAELLRVKLTWRNAHKIWRSMYAVLYWARKRQHGRHFPLERKHQAAKMTSNYCENLSMRRKMEQTHLQTQKWPQHISCGQLDQANKFPLAFALYCLLKVICASHKTQCSAAYILGFDVGWCS